MAENEITVYEPIDKEKVKTQILEICTDKGKYNY